MSLTSTLKKVEDERNELKAANEALVAAHAEQVAELQGKVAEADGKTEVALKELADCVGELEKRNAEIAEEKAEYAAAQKQCGEMAELMEKERAAREKAEQALADPAFAMLSNGDKPVADGGEAGDSPKSLCEQLAAIEDPAQRNRFYTANKAAIKAESRKA